MKKCYFWGYNKKKYTKGCVPIYFLIESLDGYTIIKK